MQQSCRCKPDVGVSTITLCPQQSAAETAAIESSSGNSLPMRRSRRGRLAQFKIMDRVDADGRRDRLRLVGDGECNAIRRACFPPAWPFATGPMMHRTDRIPLTTLRDATGRNHATRTSAEPSRPMIFITQIHRRRWIVMIATELH